MFSTYKWRDIQWTISPLYIKAMKWDGGEAKDLKRIFVGLNELNSPEHNLEVPTIDGIRYAVIGDYIIKEYGGYYAIRKEERFNELYEPISMDTV